MKTLDLYSLSMRELLLAPNADGLRPLDRAMGRGAQVTAAFMTGLNSLELTRGDRIAILTAARPDGRSPLLAAMRDTAASATGAVGAFVEGVLASKLADRQKTQVLLPQDRVGAVRELLAARPALAAVWQARLDKSALFELSLALAPPADPKALGAARGLLSSYDGTANFSRLAGPAGEADAGRFSSRVHAVLRAGISLQDKRALLTAPDAGGRSLLYRLMAVGAHKHVEVLAKALGCGAFGSDRVPMLEAWAPRVELTALTRALQQDHQPAVEAWMRQALALFAETALPAPERERLLQGLPASAQGPVRARATAALEDAFTAKAVWARQVARAGSAELDTASKQRLLSLVGRESLLQAR